MKCIVEPPRAVFVTRFTAQRPPDSLQQQWGGDWSKLHSSCQPSDYFQPSHIVSTAPSLTHVCTMSIFLSPASQEGFYLCLIFALLAVLRNCQNNSTAWPSGNKILGALIVYITRYRNSKSHRHVVKKNTLCVVIWGSRWDRMSHDGIMHFIGNFQRDHKLSPWQLQHTWWTLNRIHYNCILPLEPHHFIKIFKHHYVLYCTFFPNKRVHQEEKEPEMCVNKYILKIWVSPFSSSSSSFHCSPQASLEQINCLHLTQSSTFSAFTPANFMSSFTTSINLLLALPLGVLPASSIVSLPLSIHSLPLLCTFPNHLSDVICKAWSTCCVPDAAVPDLMHRDHSHREPQY